MKLSLSVRVAESFWNKRETSMSLDELATVAAEHGYHALCMRASQIGVHSSADETTAAVRLLRERGLAVSMVTGDFPIPQNTDDGPDALRNITPYLDLAATLGVDLLRIAMKTEEDIEFAQRAADEAGERNMKLAHQCHNSSLFEEVDVSLEIIERVGRSNFGLTYEPANLEVCGQEYGADTIERFAPHIFNVYFQNQRLGAEGDSSMTTWCRGEVSFFEIPVWEEGGIDFPAIMAALQRIGYDAYVTIHQASAGLGGAEVAARESARFLHSIGDFESR